MNQQVIINIVFNAADVDDALHGPALGTNPLPFGVLCQAVLHAGPIFVGEDYQCRRQVVASGETPKAEFRRGQVGSRGWGGGCGEREGTICQSKDPFWGG